ncbi:unnamed protein product [Kluyveromyces dobzhanskii CBS 2104]|uniref:WGS project CCBQ000000000 data, contig 00008 n=1 Tax=Kluyveromyces dobzhanskii CBS 2104 TaxID=1427455 RepID=A0A0A8L743_9SACH|nr:unnamed protein product [Kluyveromyces dobzhanskii CBS 2104]
MSIQHFSPLDGLQKRTDNESDLMRLQQENVSVISFDSIQTTGRLLDKLDLNAEEELLLQRALEENKAKNNHQEMLLENKQKPSVCLPASGFPSLRHSSGHSGSGHRRMFSTGSTQIISEETKVESSKAFAVENNVADLRYSYIAVEEGDDDEDVKSQATDGSEVSSHHKATATSNVERSGAVENHQPLNIEKFRFRKHEPVRFNVTPPVTDMVFSPYNKYEFGTPVNTPSHTPKTSVSSFVLNDPTVISSSESVHTTGVAAAFQTPKKSTASKSQASYPFDVSTPPNKDFKKGHQAKKSSFSLKNLFRSPKMAQNQNQSEIGADDFSSPMSDSTIVRTPAKSVSAPNTPLANFTFPHQNSFYEQNAGLNNETDNKFISKNKNSTEIPFEDPNENHKRAFSKGRGVFTNASHANHQRTESQTPSSPKRSQHTYKMLLDPRPSLGPGTIPVSKIPSGASSSSNSSTKSRNDRERFVQQTFASQPEVSQRSNINKRLIAKQRINLAIELRNKGDLKGSTAHLKEACKLEDRTAFLLYGLALRYGSGTEIDLHESFNWIRGATGIKDLKNTVLHGNISPFDLPEPLPSLDNDAAAPALYECGIAYLKGYGVSANEIKGLKCLEYAASLGHVDSMCLCGTIWSKTTSNRKKNTKRAAKWFRIAKDQGADLIGADWIYKKDYM